MSKPYDFEFITGALGLVRYSGGAFNPAHVVTINYAPAGDDLIITLTESEVIRLTEADALEMETMIRQRQDDIKAKQREQIKEQILTQHSVIQEINNNPAPGHIVPPTLLMKGKRH